MPARALVVAATLVTGTGLGGAAYQAARTTLPAAPSPDTAAVVTPAGPAVPCGDPVAAAADPACTVVVPLPAPELAAGNSTPSSAGAGAVPAADVVTPEPSFSGDHADGHSRHDGSDDGPDHDLHDDGSHRHSGEGEADRHGGEGEADRHGGDDARDDDDREDRGDDNTDDRADDKADDRADDNGGDIDRDDRTEPGDDRDD